MPYSQNSLSGGIKLPGNGTPQVRLPRVLQPVDWFNTALAMSPKSLNCCCFEMHNKCRFPATVSSRLSNAEI